MGLLMWIIVGAIAGWLAGKFMKGAGLGLIGNVVVGIIGALVGGSIASTLLNVPNAISSFNLTTIIVALLGAIIVLVVVRLLKR